MIKSPQSKLLEKFLIKIKSIYLHELRDVDINAIARFFHWLHSNIIVGKEVDSQVS